MTARRIPQTGNARIYCGHPSFSQFVESHGQNDHRADDHLLPVGIGSQQVAAVRQQSHDERAHQRSQHAAFAAAQAPAADHDRRDAGQLVALAAGRLAGHQPRGLDHSRQAGEQAGDARRRRWYGIAPARPHKTPPRDCCRWKTRSGQGACAPASRASRPRRAAESTARTERPAECLRPDKKRTAEYRVPAGLSK